MKHRMVIDIVHAFEACFKETQAAALSENALYSAVNRYWRHIRELSLYFLPFHTSKLLISSKHMVTHRMSWSKFNLN